MEITENTSVGAIVSENYKTAAVFKQYGIDFYCEGRHSIRRACKKEAISDLQKSKLIQELTITLQTSANGTPIDVNTWPLDLLITYIEKKHHRYVEDNIPVIKEYLNKITAVHGGVHPELKEIKTIFKEAAGQLAMHMKKEELILFPYIKKMVIAANTGSPLKTPNFGTIKNPIDQMDAEHYFEGEAFRKTEKLSGNFIPPADGCTTYEAAYTKLKEFVSDLYFHIHLENNILFKKAIELEEELL